MSRSDSERRELEHPPGLKQPRKALLAQIEEAVSEQIRGWLQTGSQTTRTSANSSGCASILAATWSTESRSTRTPSLGRSRYGFRAGPQQAK